jgi:chemotaxis protein methyltransferase CheR
MDRQVFERFREIVQREAGISLGAEKHTLLANRISKRLMKLGVSSEREYLEIIESDLEGPELLQLIDAISTNVTYFWREQAHFEFLAQDLNQRRMEGREIKIWCAASSSGEEPFCLAAVAHRWLQQPGTRAKVRILATDISTKVLGVANLALYDPKQLRDTPAEFARRYFPVKNVDGESRVVVDEALREMVAFRKLNLSKFPFPLKGDLDYIFCRNVMIYFDKELRQQIISEFTRLLRPQGVLVISHSENLMGISQTLKSVQPGVYRKC